MPEQPTLWNRMVAVMSGEVPADTLEAYRRASLAVYDALEHCETHRVKAREDGQNAWTLPKATQYEILCTWNAFVLQTLGDRFLDADYKGNPLTVGFVLPITADQILRFYTQVEGWLNRAGQAHHNPHYVLDVAVPAELPAWSEVEPCPNAHLFGMMEAMCAVREHTEAALLFLNQSPPTKPEQEKHLHAIRQLHAAAMTKARYAEDMMGGNPTRDVHERVEEHVKEAIEQFYLLGQLLAMPEIASKAIAVPPAPPLVPPKPASPISAPIASGLPFAPPYFAPSGTPNVAPNFSLPGQSGFDEWCLTDPNSLARWQKDAEARKAIKTLWKLDPSPAETLRIKGEIDAAFARGEIRYALDRYGKKLGHFFCCPWAPVYEVVRPLTLNGRRLKTLEQFIFNVTCEGVNLGAPFKREIMTGNFTPTSRYEYGDPDEEPDH